MDKLVFALLAALCLPFSKDDAVNALSAGVQIHPAGPKHFIYLDSEVAFGCLVVGQLHTGTTYILKLSFKNEAIFRCESNSTEYVVDPEFKKGCNQTIRPEGGVYTCYLLDSAGSEVRDSMELYVIDPLLNSTVDIIDLSTGDTVDISSGTVCQKADGNQALECTVRDTKPGIWNITWLVGDTQVRGSLISETNGTGGLVNASSRVTLPVQREGDFWTNLTCLATVFDRVSINVTVQLRTCSVPNATMDLLDLSTGDLVGINSDPICIQSDMTFECSVRDARPGLWNITWVLGERFRHTGSNETTVGATGGLVNVTSRFTLPESQNKFLEKNLSCLAESLDRESSLIVTVQLQSCYGEHSNPTIDMIDPLTGDLVEYNSRSTCIHPDSARTFQCTVRDIKPVDWNITWILDETKVEPVSMGATPSTGGLVNMSSMYRVSALGNEGIRKLACYATGPEGESLDFTVQITICSSDATATMDVVDLWTGDQVGVDSEPACIQSGAKRTFECTLRQATDAWRISWIIDDTEVDNGSMGLRAGQGELLTSRFTVSNQENDGLIKSLTCLARGPGEDTPSITIQLRPCVESVPSANIDNTVLVLVISVLGALLVFGGVAFVIFAARTKRRTRNMTLPPSVKGSQDVVESVAETEKAASDKESDTSVPEAIATYENTITPQDASSAEDKDSGLPPWATGWGILWRDLVVDERVLGTGNFGEVRSGTVRKDGELTKSAIKMLKGYVSRSDREDFMDEFWTMTSIGYHPNIVLLLGACQHQDILYVALEYLPHGDLRSYLRTARSQSDSDEDALSSDQLIKFALDVACGMEHLASAGIIHRDLAARNILLGEGLVAKVSDFGLARGEDIYVQTSRRRVPIRWLAIESVKDQMYTTQSDVWSFGILLWEIATFGGTPYPSIQNEMLAAALKRGYRMPKPGNCHDQIYTLMCECWDEDPNNRPTFSDLVYILSDMADNRIKHTYMAVVRDQYQNLSAIRPELDDD